MTTSQRLRSMTAGDNDPASGLGPADCVAFATDLATREALSLACGQRFGGSAEIKEGDSRAVLEFLASGSFSGKTLIFDVAGSDDPLTAILPVLTALPHDTQVIVIGSVNDIQIYREMIESGVADYLVKPLTATTLLQTFQKIDQQVAAVAALSVPAAPEVKTKDKKPVIVVLGTRGGVGASSFSSNLAWAAANEFHIETSLVDLDLQYGTIALGLDIEPTRGLREALENPDRIDSLFVNSSSSRIGKSLTVMAAEEPVSDPIRIAGDALKRLVEALNQERACIVIDVPRSETHLRSQALGVATHVVVVTEPSLAGLRDSIRLLGMVQTYAPDARVFFVANRSGPNKEGAIKRPEFEKAFGRAIDAEIPEDIKAAAQAANSGKPIFAVAPNSKTTKAIREMAIKLLTKPEDKSNMKGEKKGSFWKLGRK